MKTCRTVALVEPSGAVVLCGRPAIRFFMDQPICLKCWLKVKELKESD